MRIILVDDDHSLRNLYTVAIDKYFNKNIDLISCSSGNEAIKSIRNNENIDLIISDYKMEDGNGGELYNFILKKNYKIPFILLTSQSLQQVSIDTAFSEVTFNEGIIYYIKKPIKLDLLVNKIKQILDLPYNIAKDPHYKKIRIIYFLRFNKVLCDVYIKINPKKFIKFFSTGDVYNYNDIYKYVPRKVEYLYIKPEDYDAFCVGLAYTPFLVEDASLSTHQIEENIISTIQVVHEIVKSIGMTPLIVDLVDKTTNQLDTLISRDTKIHHIFFSIRKRKDYIHDHSFLVAYTSATICGQINWNSNEIRNKLTFAAIIHDSLIDDPRICYDIDQKNPLNESLSKKDIASYKEHPHHTFILLKDCKYIPPNIDFIVYRHHETPDRNGFPRGLGPNEISPLDGIFIVAHSFVNELYRIDFDQNQKKDILTSMKNRFNQGNYKTPFEALFYIFSKI